MKQLRPVAVFKWKYKEHTSPQAPRERIQVEESRGLFHQFGCDFENIAGNPGNYSTAIIELPSGKIINHPVELVRFLDRQSEDVV